MVDIYKFLTKDTKLEIVYTDKLGVSFILNSEIKEVQEDKILIAKPLPLEENVTIEENGKIRIIICTEIGIFSGNASILKRDFGPGQDVFISFPYNNQHCQRREYVRVPIHTTLELSMFKEGSLVLKQAFKTKNLSGKGCCFISQKELPQADKMKVLLNIEDEQLDLVCEKVYTREVHLNNDKIFLNALNFTNIQTDDINKIIRACFKFQLEQRRNEKLFSSI
ncbi:MAG: PilZ domain-containing protein [Candidatus Gastranaerophilales bacterium]|nr:PilZ domain-containing protein [Candidatus Gastranaerophilales bacterium]